MSDFLLESYQYEDLPDPPPGTFRIVELLSRETGDIVSCLRHVADWSDPPEYEALSYGMIQIPELQSFAMVKR